MEHVDAEAEDEHGGCYDRHTFIEGETSVRLKTSPASSGQ
jgi:hypothetical protein